MLEEGEVDGAVGAVVEEVGIGGEGIVFAVLEDEDAVGSEDVGGKNLGGDVG